MSREVRTCRNVWRKVARWWDNLSLTHQLARVLGMATRKGQELGEETDYELAFGSDELAQMELDYADGIEELPHLRLAEEPPCSWGSPEQCSSARLALFTAGQPVYHAIFGNGVVLENEDHDDVHLHIQFSDDKFGRMKLKAYYAVPKMVVLP